MLSPSEAIHRFGRRLDGFSYRFWQLFRRVRPGQPRTVTIIPPTGYDAPHKFTFYLLAEREPDCANRIEGVCAVSPAANPADR